MKPLIETLIALALLIGAYGWVLCLAMGKRAPKPFCGHPTCVGRGRCVGHRPDGRI